MDREIVDEAVLARFGMRVNRARRRAGMTLKQLAAAGGPSDKRTLAIEKGRYPVPDDETLKKLDAALKLEAGTAWRSLYDDTELIPEQASPSDTTYTEDEVQALRAFESAAERRGMGSLVVNKQADGDGFGIVVSREGLAKLTEQLNALSDPESP